MSLYAILHSPCFPNESTLQFLVLLVVLSIVFMQYCIYILAEGIILPFLPLERYSQDLPERHRRHCGPHSAPDHCRRCRSHYSGGLVHEPAEKIMEKIVPKIRKTILRPMLLLVIAAPMALIMPGPSGLLSGQHRLIHHQLPEPEHSLAGGSRDGRHNFFNGKDDVHPAGAVQPAVLHR